MVRPEDLPEKVKQSIELYKSNVLVPLEVRMYIVYKIIMYILSLQNYMIEHNRQYLIELDANLPPLDLFKVVCLPPVLYPNYFHAGSSD